MFHAFVHIGDIHLHSTHPRNAARLAAFDEVITAGLALPHLAAWLLPGDLFHARSTVEDRNDLAVRLLRMASRAPVVVAYGNHDVPGDLDVFGKLAARWPVLVVSTPQILTVPLATGRTAAIAVLPYPTRAGLVAAGTPSGELLEVAHQALTDVMRGLGMELNRATQDGAIPLFIGHVNVAGALASCGQPQIGREIELDAMLLDLLGPVYKGLNHIHKSQAIGGAHYAGSVCRMDFGETEDKGFIVVEVSDDAELLPAVRFVGVSVLPMFHVEGALSRADGFTYRVTKGPGGELATPPEVPCPVCQGTGDGDRDPVEGTLPCDICRGHGAVPDWTGCEVRVRYTFNASERGMLDDGLARAPFAAAARVELEPIAVPDRGLRAPEVAAARTLAAKVTEWCRLNGAAATDRVLAKLALLEQSDQIAVLSAVNAEAVALENGHAAEEGRAA